MTSVAEVRAELFLVLDELDVAQVYRHPRLNYEYPAFVITADALDFRSAMGGSRQLGFSVVVMDLLTDDDSSGDSLDELTEIAATALLAESRYDVQPAADIEAALTQDGRTIIQRRIPIGVYGVKVLLVHPGPEFSVVDVYRGLAKGLRAQGCEVGVYNLDDRLEFYSRAGIRQDDGTYTRAFDENAAVEMAACGIEQVCYEWWPDVIVMVSGFFVPPRLWAVLKRRPHHVVYWATESPYEDDRQAHGARHADTVILNDPTNLEHFRTDVNERTFYLPHSYDPDVHFPGTVAPVRDFVFVGTGFPSRVEWFEQVDWAGVDARFGGFWRTLADDSPLMPLLLDDRANCTDNATTAALYRSSRVSANLYRKEHSDGDGSHADGWAMGPREVELAACGTFFFREPRGEGDALFPALPTLTTPEAFTEELRWWLAHDRQRCSAATGARMNIADRTFTNTAGSLLELVERAGRKIAA